MKNRMARPAPPSASSRNKKPAPLRLGAEAFQSLFENTPLPMWIYSLKTLEFIAVNDAAVAHYGYSREEFLRMQITEIRPPEELPRLFSNMEHQRTEWVHSGQARHRLKNGTIIDVEYDSHTLEVPRQDAVIVVARDITERKRSEERLYLLSQIVERSPEMIGLGDPDGHITYANRAFLKAFGYSEEEILGKHFSCTFSPTNPAALMAEIAKGETKYLEGDGWQGECLRIRRDGKEFPVLLSRGAIRNLEGRAVGTFGVSRDITERKREEEDIRRLAAIVESSFDAIMSTTLEGSVLTWNSGAERIYGYSAAEIIGRNIGIVVPAEQHDEVSGVLGKVKQGEKLEQFETTAVRKDGKVIHILLTASPIKDASGRIVGISDIVRDISDDKRMEQMFRQAQKMEAVGRLAGGVAHDFNNLLGVIIGYTETLLDRIGHDAELRGQAEQIGKAANRAAALTRQLLAFSRQQVLEPKILNLDIVVAEVEKMLHRLIGEDIEILTLLNSSPGSVKADQGQMEQVIMNLAVNARDAMPQGGKLIIETSNVEAGEEYAQSHQPFLAGWYILLTVSDTGTGMDQETKSHLFEPFFTTKELGRGTGLGLATVYGVVKQSGGYIWAYSEPGHGSVFKIYLPRVDQAALKIRASGESVQLLRGTETVLLVEDEQSLRALTRDLLERSDYKVLEASSGDHALEVAERHGGPIHLLLTDVVMPGMNGAALAANLAPLHPEMKVLFMSGYTGGFATQIGLLGAGATVLQKPFSRDALLRKLREVLEEAEVPKTN
ncbi:MAG TPA: PAS domain S-box protein [Candidatus Acidoferrum sp.]|nr:PAS domain S-box protein [Candidatus Acidoferrum sp.]